MADPLAALRATLQRRYEIERELGRGGMATVYLARDLRHGRQVAIKVLDPELASVLGPERFVREIQTVAGLQHPHVLPLLDSGAEQGQFYSVTPYVEGESLRQRLTKEHQLPQDEAVRLTIEIAQALDYAHRKGIVHRDIKPDNILLADGHATVADFGIARAVRESGGERLTKTGVTLGSPVYMSPEQYAGRHDVDGRSDLYNLGVTLYEMLAGQPPFTGPAESLAYQHMNLTPRPIRELRPSVPPAVEAALMRVLAKTPADRFTSGAHFAAALEGSGVPSQGLNPDPPPRTRPATAPARARRAAVAIFAIAAVAVLAFTLWRTGAFRRENSANAPRQWVWLAEFDGPTDDQTLAPAARDLVAAALEQSRALAVVPAEQVHVGLRNADLPETTRVSGEIARQLAFRSSIPVVIEGRVGRIGTGYTLALKAIQAEDGRTIESVTGRAATDRDLVPALTRLARDLRRGLGERVEVFANNRSEIEAPTPSFEAFQLYRQGNARIGASDAWGAIPFMRRAIAIDSAFASAWVGLGTAWGNLARDDSALAAYRTALRFADRLPPSRRYDVEGKIAAQRGDFEASVAAYDALLALGPSPGERSLALNNKAGALARLGRTEEALELFRQAAETQPVGPSQLHLTNIAEGYIGLRRTAEARTYLSRVQGPIVTLQLMEAAMVDRSWRSADSLARLLESGPVPLFQSIGGGTRVSIRAARGEIRAAPQAYQQLIEKAVRRNEPRVAYQLWNQSRDLSRRAGFPDVPPPAGLGAGGWRIAADAVLAAEARDSVRARRALEGWPADAVESDRVAVSHFVEATLDYEAGRWQQAVHELDGFALGGVRGTPGHKSALRQRARWMMADAYMRLGHPDSAAARLELILAPVQGEVPHHLSIGVWEPWVRARLVGLYTGLGRPDDARRHWELLTETCTNPDPPVAALIANARAALQGASARP